MKKLISDKMFTMYAKLIVVLSSITMLYSGIAMGSYAITDTIKYGRLYEENVFFFGFGGFLVFLSIVAFAFAFGVKVSE